MVHLLLYWQRTFNLDDKLIWKKSAESQECFVRDTICEHLLHTHSFVINFHHSKSCKLPVYYIELRNGIKLILRGNFYDWKVSVELPETPIHVPSSIYYLPEDCLSWQKIDNNKYETIPRCYLEGFKDEWAYEGYNLIEPSKKFTIEVPTDEDLYVIMHYLKHAYPDKIANAEDDKRSVEEIQQSIDYILSNFGGTEIRKDENGKDVYNWKGDPETVMSISNIFWKTYYKAYRTENVQEPEDNSKSYAEIICSSPEVHEEFLMEEQIYLQALSRFKD